ncbi:glycoside hydrolase family 15 protein [Halomarina salina]|uniref:Glycoside hydrolase family 15 protein n=1 Tax=Halomarina salina TaxID=1872699 RepID=A0ABD5RPM7_9EURY|nr:glycoside hydrolase family 15 protein [Halomarina salina]
MDEFRPLEEYGLIGNLETCALVGQDGAVDWCCLPYIDSPSVFADILDPDEGGRFSVTPSGEFEATQQYMERTNVLQTTFETESGTVTLTDFMPVIEERENEEPQRRGIYRQVACTEGTVELDVEFSPRFDFARAETTVESIEEGAFASGDDRRLFLSSPVDLDTDGDGATATFSLDAHESAWFTLGYMMHTPDDDENCEALLDRTVDYWREWAHSCDESECLFGGVGHDHVVRSELVLKLLYYRETGAMVAAPTTSLPEDPGGVRNWDYRYSWIRDGSVTVRALTGLGHVEEATGFVDRFLEHSREGDTAEVQPLYGVEGEIDLEEEHLDHFRGYLDSQPVRVGNEAADQVQLDVYGDLVLAYYQRFWSDGGEISDENWESLSGIADYVSEHWDDEGAGIWELRGEPRQLVHSKVMCWIALDRILDLADRTGRDGPLDEWRDAHEAIRSSVLEHGYDEEVGAFTQSYEGTEMDATGLLIALSGILPFDDERVVSTVETVQEQLANDDGLVYRYEDDDLEGDEARFVFCSFWLVNALVAIGRTDEAWTVFENILDYASPLGLIAEEIDAENDRQLGNFPQGFSHIGLVNSAMYLREGDYDWANVDPLGGPTLVQEGDQEDQQGFEGKELTQESER